MRIGIDFDNTIVCYDDAFHKAAVLQGLIPAEIGKSKGEVRDYLRSVGKESAWTELQGYIYGARMDLATSFPGVADFFSQCHLQKIPAFIVSHKTLIPYLGPPYNLHESAKQWLSKQSFSFSPPAHFELTLQEKLARIKTLGCTVFIDDLPELLEEKHFPEGVIKVLFDPNQLHSEKFSYLRVTSWKELAERILPAAPCLMLS